MSSYAHFFIDAALTDVDGQPLWWSARHVVAVAEDQPTGTPDAFIEALIVQDVDPVESGLDETTDRYDADWCPNKPQPRLVREGDLLKRVTQSTWPTFRARRNQHRTDHGLPRLVVRSDIRDRATGDRGPHHALRHPWPADIFTQAGSVKRDGIRQVFLEFFPSEPSTYMRAEAPTAAEAEDRLWATFNRYLACPGHTYETRRYRNGMGFCTRCGLATSKAFTPEDLGSVCVVCGVGTFWSLIEIEGGEPWVVCETHSPPHYADFDVHLLGAEADVDGARMLDETALAVLEEHFPTGRSWADLDFDSRWATIREVRRELVRRARG